MSDEEKDYARRSQLEENLARQCDPIDEAKYENARWWRNLNRIMSVIGALLIAAIVCADVCFHRVPNTNSIS
jgi:hypothetical protein